MKKGLVPRSFNKVGFTLMELLIVVTLLVLLATALLVRLDPWTQINKGQDSKRKSELASLQKVFEDFYNDKQCYPKPDEVCYKDKTLTVCPICGNDVDSPDFSPYLSRLPCDARQPRKKYLYQVDSTSCPTWYRIYTTLSNRSDPIIAQNCQYGCGPAPDFSYNYGVTSPNAILEATLNLCTDAPTLRFLNDQDDCNTCGGVANGDPPVPYEYCLATKPGETYYTDEDCTVTCTQ